MIYIYIIAWFFAGNLVIRLCEYLLNPYRNNNATSDLNALSLLIFILFANLLWPIVLIFLAFDRLLYYSKNKNFNDFIKKLIIRVWGLK